MTSVYSSWHSATIPLRDFPRAGPLLQDGDEAIRTEQRRARSLLFRMERMEWYAETWDDFDRLHAAELESWKIPAMRQLYADTYRQLVGVHPERRGEFRRCLQLIADDGIGTVNATMDDINQLTYAKGVADSLSADDVFA